MKATPRVYAGLALVTLATLAFQILLTRIMSVTMWYHFAFMAISIAMFGMTAGALRVYLRPELYPQERLRERLGNACLLFASTMVLAVMAHLALPAGSVWTPVLTYLVAAVPFTASGVVVCLVLTRFPDEIGRLYAVDLAGAAVGCLAVLGLLELVDGIAAVFALAALVAAAGWLLLPRDHRHRRTAVAMVVVGLAIAAGNDLFGQREVPLLRVWQAKGQRLEPPLYERWNSFSRIAVHRMELRPTGWGLSPTYRAERDVEQRWLTMDSCAGTLLTAFDGDLERLDHLRYDITNLVHLLRRGRVLVIGAGGGRDVLSALLFDQPEVVAVELNPDILEAVNIRFGDFTGHLDRLPGVRFVVDEARSWTARQEESFDVIQASWIDTWAATAAGAFVLSENALYTVEAWRIFLQHLEDDGVMTFTRLYLEDDPREAQRLLALARAALVDAGVERPEAHVMLVLNREGESAGWPVPGNATVLVGRRPFTAADVATIEAAVERLAFLPGYLPGRDVDPRFTAIARGEPPPPSPAGSPARLDPPTDDSPFFFNMAHVSDLLDPRIWHRTRDDPSLRGLRTLAILVVTVVVLTVLFLMAPLLRRARHAPGKSELDLVAYFCAIGLGFMLVEVAQVQRLILFLGHPTYGLSVVLFALLIGGGAGSWLAGRLAVDAAGRIRALLVVLVAVVAAGGVATPWLVRTFERADNPSRVAVAAGLMLALGMVMGMAFPLGMRLASRRAPALTPWLWGVNGATSVCASVLAVAISLEAGIGVTYWCGAACYVVALATIWFGTSSAISSRSGS